MRTPLNGVIGFTRQLLKTSLTPSQTDYMQTIEKSARNLLGIINDILDFSKLEAGKLQLEHIPFSLRDTLNETMHLLGPSAHDKQLELSLRVDADVPDYLTGDPMRLQQVLTNLTGNAIKFTEQGNVDVHIEQTGSGNHKVRLNVQSAIPASASPKSSNISCSRPSIRPTHPSPAVMAARAWASLSPRSWCSRWAARSL